jgi:WD40 repeat protein
LNREDYNLLRTFPAIGAPIYAIAFSKDGSLVACGGRGSEVVVFKTIDGSKVASIKGFEGSVHSLSFHPKTGELVVSGFDGKIYFYGMPDGKLAKSFVPVPMGKQQAAIEGRAHIHVGQAF